LDVTGPAWLRFTLAYDLEDSKLLLLMSVRFYFLLTTLLVASSTACFCPGESSSRQGPSPEPLHSDDAVRRAGTNAMPALLQMLEALDPALNYKGVKGFASLGADGKAAVPALIRIFHRAISPSSQYRTAQALGSIGPAARSAASALLTGTTNTDATVRSCSIVALSRVQADPELLLPAFLKGLADPDYEVQSMAAAMLGMLGTRARTAIPALVEWRRTKQSGTRDGLANLALKRIDPEAFSGEAELWPFGPAGGPGDGSDSTRVIRGWFTNQVDLQRLVWGAPASNGLRVACSFVPAQKTYAYGEILKDHVVFHNGGAEPVFFGRWGRGGGNLVVTEEQGGALPMTEFLYTCIEPTDLFRLEPGQIVETDSFHSTGIGRSAEGSRQNLIAAIGAVPGTVCRVSWTFLVRAPGTNILVKSAEQKIRITAKGTAAPSTAQPK
jgi:hypothetical protein